MKLLTHNIENIMVSKGNTTSCFDVGGQITRPAKILLWQSPKFLTFCLMPTLEYFWKKNLK